MPCNLKPDPSGTFDRLAPAKTNVTVFVASASKTVRITAATLNGAVVAINADGSIAFVVAQGINILQLAFAASDPDEVFQINENCGGAQSQLLRNWRFRPTPTEPGGPTTQLQIGGTA